MLEKGEVISAKQLWQRFTLCSSFFYLLTVGLVCNIPSAGAQEDNQACEVITIVEQDLSHQKKSRVDAKVFAKLKGKTIGKITVKQLSIFNENDPDENNRLYRFFNMLHVNTRKGVVLSQLQFKTGDKINPSVMEETGRILRTRQYFTNAYVVPEKICGDRVDVLVVTQDAWVLEPQFSFSHNSGNNQSGFGIIDGNLLGSGNSLSIGYSENQLRNTVSYRFTNPHVFNRPVAVDFLYQDTSDGRNSLVDISHPFYSLNTPWSAGVQLSDLALVETIRARDKIINEYRHQSMADQIYAGLATDINSHNTQRWLVGFTHEEDSFVPIATTLGSIPRHDKAVYPWVEYQYIENKFGVFKNLNQIQRPEDIALGQNFSVRLGMAGTAFGNPDDVLRYKADYVNLVDISDQHIFELELKLDGREHLQISELDPKILTSSLAYSYLEDEKNRWYARIEYGVGNNLPQYQELTVGDLTGLRGYPTDYLRGEKRYTLTIERRYFSDVHIFNLLRMGAVVFVDAGKAWGLPEMPDAPLLSDVGIGLRFSSSKVRIGNVIHLDVAVPTSAKTGISSYQIAVGAEQKF